MPASCTIDSVAGVVTTTVRPPVTAKELSDELRRVIESPDFRPGLNGVADVRGTDAEWTPNDLRMVADVLKAHREDILPSRTAIVVSGDAEYGMARMFQGLSGTTSVETAIFRDMDEAKAWLSADD